MSKRGRVIKRRFLTCLAGGIMLLSGCDTAGSSPAFPLPSGTAISSPAASTSNTGDATIPTPLPRGTAGVLRSAPILKWTRVAGQVETNPLVTGGVVYVTTNYQISALDATTGKTKWQVAAPGAGYLVSSPAVTDGLLYVGATSWHDIDTRISTVTAYALDIQTGTIRWQHNLTHDRSEDAANPVAAGGLVYFGTGWSDMSCCEFAGHGGHIVALDGKTGQPVWQVATTGHYGSGGMPTTTFGVAQGLLYRGLDYTNPNPSNFQIHAQDAKTGKAIWAVTADMGFSLVALDGALYSQDRQQLVSLDGKTGQKRWRWTAAPPRDWLSDPLVAGDTVYIVGNEGRSSCFEGPCPPPKNHTDTLYALDTATGHPRWQQEIQGGNNMTLRLTLFGEYLCYASADVVDGIQHWKLRAVDRSDGTFAWTVPIDDNFYNVPATDGKNLYLGTEGGTVYGLQLP